MRFQRGPSLPPMKEKRPLSVAELQQQRCAVSDPVQAEPAAAQFCKGWCTPLWQATEDSGLRTLSMGLGQHLSSQKVSAPWLWPYRLRKMRSP